LSARQRYDGAIMRRTFATLLALAAASVAVAAAALVQGDIPSVLKKPAPAADGHPTKLARAGESKCAPCHAEITEEWAATTHAMAWASETYQEELKGRKKAESCHACHIPTPLHVSGLGNKPDARKDDLHFGVSCEACHVDASGAMLGPTGAATDAHASKKSDTMIGAGTNALCISCHRTNVGPVIGIAKDFEASDLPAKGATCVGCHCAPTKEVELEGGGKRVVRSHELQTPRDPAFLALAFAFKARVAGGKTTVEVANQAGHRVPGLRGREIEITAHALDGGGTELARATWKVDTDSYLPIGETATFEIAAAATKVKLVGKHLDPRWKETVVFVEREIVP
jgi:hypothetical protein